MAWNIFGRRNAGAKDQGGGVDRQIHDIIGKGPAEVQNNPNYRTFSRVNGDIQAIINSRSMISQAVERQNKVWANPSSAVLFGEDFLAMPVATNKAQRIAMYRSIASYPICSWCLDEIADDFVHEDENGDVITLRLPERLNAIQQDVVQNEFRKFMEHFRIMDEGYNIIRRFLTEGELAWENVISPNHPEKGIIGVKFLPAEYYETLVDTETGYPVGIVFDTEQFSRDKRQMFMNSFAGSAQIFNAMTEVSYSFQFSKDTCVPLLWNQVTYINSGFSSEDYLVTYPLIENAKQQYHRLALLEDAAVILRVTHAPERLLFNVSTGKMTQNFADEYVRRFAAELKSKKVASPDGNSVQGVYNPVTMLKSYVFGKSDGNDGTSVESVGSSATYDQMDDVEYFLRQLLKQFKVPWSRYKTPENTMEKNDSISYEEYAFSRMILRFQRRFASGFKKSFVTHLKLRGIWDKQGYELTESDINVQFTKPVLYDIYEQQKLVDAKMTIYNAFADKDEISKISVMKKYLGWTDQDVADNYMNIIREKQMTAVGDFFADQISEENPPIDFKSPVRLKKDVDAEEKVNSNVPEAAGGEGGEGGEGGDAGGGEEGGGDMGGGEEGGEEPPDNSPPEMPEPEEPSFGLG